MDKKYFNLIEFKKNAIDVLADDLVLHYYEKNVLILTTKSLVGNHLTAIFNACSMARCSFSYFVAKNNFNDAEKCEVEKIFNKKKIDVVISFGANNCCNISKIYANLYNADLIVCPTACSSACYFSGCYVDEKTQKLVYGKQPKKIYICNDIIENTPNYLAKQGVLFVSSFYEFIINIKIENILFGYNINCNDYENILNKLNKEKENILNNDKESKLVLMDILVELGFLLERDKNITNQVFSMYCVLNQMIMENGELCLAGELLMVCCNSVLNCYHGVLNKSNIDFVDFPNYKKIVNTIYKHKINTSIINGQNFFKKILDKKQTITRLNNLKEEFCFQIDEVLKKSKNIIHCVQNQNNCFFSFSAPQTNDVLSALLVLPFVCKNNFLMNFIGGSGMLNAI